MSLCRPVSLSLRPVCILVALALMVAAMPPAARSDPSMRAYTPPPPGAYTFLTDQVMGGVSTGQARARGGADAGHLHLTGSVSTANRGGFVQTRVRLQAPLPADARGVVIRVRGNGERYFVHLRTRGTVLPWQYYQAGFDTTAEWREIRLPFTAFAPSGAMLRDTPRPATVTSLGAVAYGRDHRADLSFAWIGVY